MKAQHGLIGLLVAVALAAGAMYAARKPPFPAPPTPGLGS